MASMDSSPIATKHRGSTIDVQRSDIRALQGMLGYAVTVLTHDALSRFPVDLRADATDLWVCGCAYGHPCPDGSHGRYSVPYSACASLVLLILVDTVVPLLNTG